MAGAAFSDFDIEGSSSQITTTGFVFFDTESSSTATQVHPYVYGNVNLPEPVTWTVGLAYDDLEEGKDTNIEKVSPKFGVQWNITDDPLLRGAVFRNVKPVLANNRSLEPTQVAGFNQLYDEANGTEAWRYAVGLDHRVTRNLWIGLEATWRDITVPFADKTFDHNEQTHSAYAYWTPDTRSSADRAVCLRQVQS